VNLDLEGFEDINEQTGEPTGIKLPYIVTLKKILEKFYLLKEIMKRRS
jgi:hypothetical protein